MTMAKCNVEEWCGFAPGHEGRCIHPYVIEHKDRAQFMAWVKQYRIQHLKEQVAVLWEHLEKNPDKKMHPGYVSDFNNLMDKLAGIDPTTPAFRLTLPTGK